MCSDVLSAHTLTVLRLILQDNADLTSGYLISNWSITSLMNPGDYELVLHTVCSATSPYPGISGQWSQAIRGSIVADRHRVLESTHPANTASISAGEEISATFNLPVNCDKTVGNFWFDVKLTRNNGAEFPFTFYQVFCEEATVYISPTGDGVCMC